MARDLTSNPYNVVFYVALIWITGLCKVLGTLPPFIHMMVDAVALIYIGSFLSLKFFVFLSKPASTKDEAEKPMSLEEGWKMPLFATITLVGLFLLFKYIGKQYVNYLLIAYFAVLGASAVKFWIDNLLTNVSFLDPIKAIRLLRIESWDFQLSLYDVFAYILSVPVIVVYVIFRDWLSNNIIGMAFCLYGFENLYVGKFTTAFLMLTLFFAYDIYFVFGTSIMVTLATGIEGPIKLVFPRVVDPRMSMLGLGDILVPGLLITICLRFDLILYIRKRLEEKKASLVEIYKEIPYSFPKTYFATCFISYILGLILTIIVGVVFNAAQPALLYLVPLTIIPVTVLALIRGEIKKLFTFDEESEGNELKKLLAK